MSQQQNIFQKLDTVFRKGRMGPTITREETVERLNPLIKQHVQLHHAYTHAVRALSDRSVAEALDSTQRVQRIDIAKLKETILSNGGVPYSGTDLDGEDIQLGDSDDEILHNLHDLEDDFQNALIEERKAPHHMRTRAILDVVKKNSAGRLHQMKEIVQGRRRPQTAQG